MGVGDTVRMTNRRPSPGDSQHPAGHRHEPLRSPRPRVGLASPRSPRSTRSSTASPSSAAGDASPAATRAARRAPPPGSRSPRSAACWVAPRPEPTALGVGPAAAGGVSTPSVGIDAAQQPHLCPSITPDLPHPNFDTQALSRRDPAPSQPRCRKWSVRNVQDGPNGHSREPNGSVTVSRWRRGASGGGNGRTSAMGC